jgi:hypothetical protein
MSWVETLTLGDLITPIKSLKFSKQGFEKKVVCGESLLILRFVTNKDSIIIEILAQGEIIRFSLSIKDFEKSFTVIQRFSNTS